MGINTITKRLAKKIFSLSLFLLISLSVFATNSISVLNRSTETINYVNGNYVEYTLELENTTITKQENLTLKDTFFGSSGVEDISIEVLKSKGEGTSIDVSGVLTEGSDLEISGITLGYTPEVTDNGTVTTTEENGYLKLKIKGKIKDEFTDDIVSYGELSNNSDVLSTTAESTLTLASPNVSITKSTTNTENYLPGDKIEYNITVTNSGEGYAYGYNLLDDLSAVTTKLANDSEGSITDSSDITSGNAFDTATITLVSKGSNSGSNYTKGDSENKLNLDDNIYIAPGESLTYNIVGTTNKSAIGEIENIATISNGTDDKTSQTIKVSPKELTNPDVTIEKTVAGTEYEPGKDVTYTITVKNNSDNKFVNNYNITDNISGILTTQANGVEGPAFSSWILNVVSPTDSTNGTKVGTAISGTSTTDNININVDIAPEKEITYELVATVSDTSVGTILDDSTSDNVVESGSGIESKSPNVSITKSTTNTENYLPGDEIEYNITVTNSGEGYAYGYNLLDDLSAVTTKLANDSEGSITDSSDITSGNAFDTATITLVSKGSNSGSNYTVEDSENKLNLDDDIYIAPGESLTYNIKGITNKSAIGEIENVATISNGTDDKTSEIIKVSPEELNDSDVTIDKTVSVTEYEPGQDVTYTITVKNNTDDKFVNNYNITDNISDILTTQADGTNGQAFSSWTLNVVSPTSSNDGTKVGTAISGTSTTDNIDINVDIAPEKEITYELVATVSDTSVGTILDNSTSDNVVESGSGIKSYPSQLAISKTVDETEYSPNSTLTYQIIIENEGNGYDTDVKVKDLLSEIMDEDGKGSNKAFKSWSITSEFKSLDTATGGTPSGNSGIASEPLENTDLNVTAQIGARTKLIYTIKATVSGTVFGKIVNTASIDDKLYSDKGCFPIDPKITATLTSDYSSYPKSDDDLAAPFDITYTLTVSNDENAGFAKGVKITDLLSDISTTALNGTKISNLFDKFTITATPSDDDTKITSGGDYTLGINDTVDITAGGNVKYTITAKVKRDPSAGIIPYEDIVNSGTVIPKNKDGNDMSTINLSYTTSKKLPALKIVKSTSNMTYLPGGKITYFLTIENAGEGYANNAIVSDTLSTNFSSWTIKKIVPDTFVGTDADVDNNVSDNKDISATVDIAPRETVQYKIVGTTKSDLTDNFILNVGTVEDTQRGNTYESSVKLMENTDLGFYITKEAEEYSYAPGGKINYTVTLYNTTSEEIDFKKSGYTFKDKFSKIITNLANDKGGTTTDITGSPFEKLFVSVNNEAEEEIIDVNSDYTHQPTLAAIGESGAPSKYIYKFRGVLKDNILSDEIKNEAVVEDSSGTEMVIASHEIDGSNSGSYTRKVSESKYTPGDKITYTFTAKGVHGYLNNKNVKEDIKGIEVDLLNGKKGNPFSTGDGNPQFTVKKYINGKLDGDLNSKGTVTSSVSDNENIDQTIDVSPNDVIRYEVTGTVRQDIVGIINFDGLVTKPHRHNLVTTTTVEEGGYVAGEEITLKTTIENNSYGNASNISIEDLISSLKVDLSDGTKEGNLFPNGWTITTETLGDNGDLIEVGTYNNDQDLSTNICIPVDSTLVYEITGTVNELAVGTAVNEVTIDGDKVSADISSLSDNLTVTKEVDSYYESDKKTPVTGGYVPDGWIKYKIKIDNIGSGIADDIAVSDALSDVKTTAYKDDGTTEEIAAFSEWKILSYEIEETKAQSNIHSDIEIESLVSTSLEWKMDIPSKGSITVYVLAHVSEGAIGDIKNTVTVDGKNYSSETSESLDGEAVLTKKAYESDGVTARSNYAPGDTVVYKVTVENTGDGIISGTIKDEISKIKSLVEEDGNNGTTPEGFSFSDFTVTASKSNSGTDNITKIGRFESESTKTDIDINDVLVVAPGTTVTFEIKGTIKDNVIGDIKNTAEFENQSKSVTLKEKPSNISVEKRVTKVEDTDIAEGTDPINYNPGDTVEYEVIITNTGYGHEDNLTLTENIDKIQASIAGSLTTSTAFESYNIDITDSGNSYIRQVGLETVIDMAPGKKDKPEVVKIKVTGKLKDKVIGEIAENTVTYNNKTAKSEKLEPYDPKITYYKSFTDESGNEISEKKSFDPGETIYYKLVVENTGNGYADDLKVIDKIYDLVTSNNYKAFEDGQVTVTTKIYNESSTIDGTDDGKTYIMGDISGNSLVNSTIDLASKSKVEFYISGKTTPYAIGSLTNKVLVEGDGNPTVETGKTDNVTTESIASNIVGDKIAGIDSSVSEVLYTPNGDISYKLTFNNTGNGPGIVYIKDIVSNIKVARPGGNKVNAFQSGYKFVLKTETGTVYHPYNSTTAISSEKTISGDLDTSINLGEDSSCSFTLTGKANIQAVESIENTATYKINSETETGTDISATIDPTPGFIEITNVADVTKYTPSKQVTYTLTIKNTGKGYAQNVNVEDLLENMTGDTFGGGSGPAFKSIDTITVTPGTNSASVGSGTTTDGYEGDFDIAPGENVVIKLTGTINDNLIGEITNEPIVKYKYKDEIDQTLTAPVTLKTTPPDLTILTEISANGSTYSTNKAEYIPNEKLYYKVTLSNAGGWDTDVKLTNIINQIKATDLNGNEVSAFNEDTIKITLESGIEDNITFDSALHELDATVNIGAGKDIVFKIEGVVNEDLIGTITLDSKYANSKGATTNDTSNSVDANPEENKIEMTKTATSTNYYPKGEMVYNVVIENTGNSIVNDITFADDVNKTKVKLADGTTGDPFDSSTVTANIVSQETNLTTTIPTISVDNGTGKVTSTTTFDIKPGKKITFQIKGTVNENAVGDIVNTATYEVANGKTGKDTITTEPEDTDIVITKTATSTNYYPNGEMVYNVVIENIGNSIGNDIIFEDDVNKEQVLLADGTNGNPFDVASITREIITGGTTLTGTVPTLSKDATGKVTSTAFDIKAGEKITFQITAKVNNNVVGDIINTATYKDANGKTDESKVTTKSEYSEIVLTKIVEEPTTNEYIPGEKIKYKITIKNTGKGFGDNINIVDKISKIMVDTVNGSAVAFSPSDWEWTKETEDLPNVIPNLTSFKGKDLDIDVDIESGKTLTLYVEGTVNSQAYGDISNTVTGKNGENDIPESTVNISSSLGKIEITNTADVAKYTPSKQVTYTLTIKNTGEGYAQNVNVEDLLSTMTGDTFDGGSGSAFKSIDNITVTPGTNSASIGSGTKTNGYEGNFNIAPGENIVIKLTGTINDNLIGEIINDPVVTYADNNQIEKAPVTLETATPDLTILTEISTDGSTYSTDEAKYIPGKNLYYKVTLSNAGGWDSDVKLTNIINQIKATDLNGNEVSAFNENTIKITLESGIEDNITFDSALHELDATVNIGAGKNIVFKIEGVVNEDLIGTITLDSKYANSKGTTTNETSNSVDANPEENKIEITKTAESETYYPKGEMVYNVVIENTGNSIINDITFEDNVNEEKVLLADGSKGNPFVSTTVTANIVSEETNLTTIPTVLVDGTGKVTSTTTFDIKPGKKITFQIKGTVNENAVGDIVNTATYEVANGKTDESKVTTEPQETNIEITKTAESETYYPNGEMVYNIVIENKGNSIGNDIIFEDDINKEQVLLADGTNGNPFDVASITREIITGETTLTGTSPTLSKDTTGKVTSTSFDLKKDEKITFKITAKVNNNVVGDIINTATYKDANGKTDESKVTTKSEDSEIILTKIVEEPTSNEYIPGEKIKYKITIENTGKGFGDNINIVDKISNIMVDTVNGSAVAFSPNDWEWTKETEELPNVIPDLTSLTGKDLDIDVDIESGKTLTLYVEGTVNSQAYGDISNTVTGKNGENNIPESTVKISSSLGEIAITNTADVANYTPGKQVTYTLTITNNGEGYAQNVNVEDLLSTMTGETSGDGSLGKVFKSIDSVSTTVDDNSASIGTPSTTNGYEGNFDIAPGESIVITLTGTVNDNILGEITNDPTVKYDGNQLKAPVVLTTVPPELNIVTKISTDGSTYSQNPVNYIPGKKLYYQVTLSNIGKGWDDNVKLSNLINEIKTATSDGTESLVFVDSSIVVTLESGDNVTFDLNAHNIDATMDIAPGEDIIFKIEGVVNENIIGTITLDSKYENSNGTTSSDTSNEVLATQKNEKLSVIEKIKDLETGEFDLDESSYVPGEDVIFKIFIENTEDTFAQNIDINNYLKSMKVELADGNDGDAFSSWTIEESGTPTNVNSSITNTIESGNNLNSTGNLAPKDKYSFIVTAKVNENAVGEIENRSIYTLNSGSDNYSNTIKFIPEANKVEMTKTAESETYYPNGEMTYNVVIENKGNSIINDISFEDDVNKTKVELADGTEGIPFDISTVTSEVVASGTSLLAADYPTLSKDTTGKVTSTSFDLKKDEKITFKITAKVNENIVGQITNIASYILDGKTTDSNKVITDPEENVIEMTKTAESTTYYPNGEMTYNVVIENTGNSIINDISFADDVNKTKVELADGTEGIPFDISSITSEIVTGETTLTGTNPTLSKDATGKVTSTAFDIKKDEKITFKITAKVNENVVGQITNIASYILDGKTTDGKKVTTDPEENKIEITKTATSTTYYPNGEIVYNVVIENTGNSIVNDISFADDVNKTKVELADGTVDGDPFDATSVTSEVVTGLEYTTLTGNQPSVSPDPTTGKVTSDTFDLKKGEKITFKITAKVNENVVGQITNTASYILDGKTTDGKKVTTDPEENKIEITKTAESTTYYPNGEMIYNVVIENKGNSIVNDISFADDVNRTKVLLADGTVDGDPFDATSVTSEVVTGLEYTTLTGNQPSVSPDTTTGKVTSDTFDLKKGEKITFKITAKVNENVVGQITNIASYILDGKTTDGNKVTTDPEENKIEITKTAESTTYYPNGKIIYNVVIENKGNSIVNDISFEDDVNRTKVLLADGTVDGDPFDATSVTSEVVTGLEYTTLTGNQPTVLPDTTTGKVTSDTFDLKKGEKITFKITAKVNENVVGQITNIASYILDGKTTDGNKVTTDPEENKIKITKTADTTTYYPNGEMIYNVVIENTGNSIINDISFADDVNKEQVKLSDGTVGNPFNIKTSTVTGKVVASGTSLLAGDYPDILVDATGKVTSDTFDIKAGEKITFQIKGTVNNNVVGDIKNTATYTVANGKSGEDTEITESEKANIILTKKALVDDNLKGYLPGGKIKYEITIENKGKGFGDNINITDEISKIMVDTVSGSAAAFSENDWEWTKETEDLPNVIQNLVPFRGRDLDIKVDIESGKTLTLYVEGTVNPDAYGDITNTVTGKNGEDVIPPASATFIPSRSKVVMTHTVDKVEYEPGDYLTYTVTLTNEGPGPANGITFEDNLKDIIVKTTNNDEAAFDLSTIEIVSSTSQGGVTESTSLNISDGALTSYIENMPKDGKVTYVFKGKVRDDAVGDIINTAAFEYTDNDGTFKPFDENSIEVETEPTNAKINITKEVDKEEYIAGEDLTYTVTLENTGTGNAKNIELTDILSEIETEYVDGTTGKVFDSWKITHMITKNSSLETDVTSVSSYDDEANLNALVIDMAPGDKIEFTIVGKTNSKVKEGITNTASYEYINNDGEPDSDKATTNNSVPLLNDGKLLLTKTAMKEEVEQGEFVEYEILVSNVGETYFVNFFVEDKIPSGFEYVEGTTEMTRNGSDETFDTGDDILVTGEPVVGRTVNFSKVNLSPGESLRIRYLLKVSIGTTYGQYKNTAYALIDGELVSNEDSAIVTVVPDELFDTATIIGKVFEDINGDGYQGLATAEKIKIKGGITKDYIPNSLTLEKNNVNLKLNEKTNSLVNGIIVDKLNGISKNKVIDKNDKLTLRFLSKSKDWSPTEISTKAGTNILIDKFGNIKTVYTKDKKKGISQENLHVIRNTYKSKKKNIYLHEVKIENIGVYEEGIPGVRLIVLDGVVVETDEFGRYHVPDKWVLDKKGENFLVKLDKTSIPDGMEVLTENPLVRRISANGLNKFNFSLKEKEVK